MIGKGDTVELEIESLAFGAEGVGHLKTDDRPLRISEPQRSLAVFVEDTVPGDIVNIRIGTMKRNFARGHIVDFVKKSPLRIAPRCKHFASCGGCALQFISYGEQLKIKERHVKDAIVRIGGFDENLVMPIIGCEEPWNYRNKMEFSFSRQADCKSAPQEKCKLTLGLHVRRRHHDVTELSECFLMNDYVGSLVVKVRDFFRKKDWEGKLDGMHLLSFTVREGKNSGEVMANLTAENGEPDFLEEFAIFLRDCFAKITQSKSNELSGRSAAISPKLVSIYFTQIINFKGRPKKTIEQLLWGEECINESLKTADGAEMKFRISPQSFFQPNTHQAEVLYGLALKAADSKTTDTVFDLFCGAGTIGCFCARTAGKVYGIEINESAIKNARYNAAINGITNIEFIAGDVGKVLASIGKKPDTVIVDPPRNGMEPKAVEMIVSYSPKKIVYVSCNPSTLARDLATLKKTGYKLLSVQPVDMFPQTYHIECVAVIEK